MVNVKELLKDLEELGTDYHIDWYRINGSPIRKNLKNDKSYQRLHTFLTKLSEVDLEECEKSLDTVGSELIKGDFGWIGISEHYDEEIDTLQNLLNILKEVE